MSPIVTRLLFVLLCLIVPIIWGVTINALFHKLRPRKTTDSPSPSPSPEETSEDADDEPVIEYYI